MEDEETSESEAALDLISSQFVNLYMGQVSGTPAQGGIHVQQQWARRAFV